MRELGAKVPACRGVGDGDLCFLQSLPGRLRSPGGSDSEASACNAEDRVQSLVQEDPLEKEMATHSSTLAWEIPCTEEPGGLQSTGSQRVRHA